jgi:hypothetical protein
MDPLLVWIAVAALATLLAQAAVAKLPTRTLFEQHLAAYGVPHGRCWARPAGCCRWPKPARRWLLLTPLRTAGAVLALRCCWPMPRPWPGTARTAMRLDCGCGGEPLPLSWALVLRNLVLAAGAGVAGRR